MPSGEFSAVTRRENLERLARTTWDLLVIGGGITGAGIARDAALRGWQTALIEREDFASGTSSRTGRMVHGGLRYLAEGHFRLVAESLAERAVLWRTAARLVTPHPFMFPVYGAAPAMVKMAAGLVLYQGLALGRAVGPARLIAARRAARLEPRITTHRLAGGALYWDCLTDDARLVLEVILDAHRRGAVVANHAPAVALLRGGDRVIGAAVRDAFTDQTTEVRARIVINATGPWAERVAALAGGPPLRLRPTAGSHIVIPRPRLQTHRAIIFASPRDGRYLYLIPWAQHVVIGTTETDYTESPERICATAGDVAYILEAVSAAFPSAEVGPEDVISTFAGVRPLVDRPGIAAYHVPRDYQIVEGPPGFISVAGGKFTTFRRMAQDVVDVASGFLGGAGTRGRHGTRPRCRTAEVPIEIESVGLPREEELDGDLVPARGEGLPDLERRVIRAVRHEMAVTLCDCLIRRLRLIDEVPDQGLGVAPEVARVMAPMLGWTEADVLSQIEEYQAAVALTRRWRAA